MGNLGQTFKRIKGPLKKGRCAENANNTTNGMNACVIDCSGSPHRFWCWDESPGTPVWTSKTKGTASWPRE